MDLFSRKDVDKDAVKQSNLTKLIRSGVIEVL
jgi:hypothetical protein